MLTWRNKGAVHCLLNRSWGEPDLTASEEVQMRKGLLNAMLAVVLLSPVSIAQVQTDVVVIDRGPQTGAGAFKLRHYPFSRVFQQALSLERTLFLGK